MSRFSTSPSGNNTEYTYNVYLNPGYKLNKDGFKGNESTGDLFTLYDIPGLVGSPTISAKLAGNGFSTFTTQNVGVTPVVTAPPDNAGIVNITFPYTGKFQLTNPAGGMNLFLGQFSLISSSGPATSPNIYYAAATQRYMPGQADNSLLANNVSQLVGPNIIAEPSSLLLSGIPLPQPAGSGAGGGSVPTAAAWRLDESRRPRAQGVAFLFAFGQRIIGRCCTPRRERAPLPCLQAQGRARRVRADSVRRGPVLPKFSLSPAWLLAPRAFHNSNQGRQFGGMAFATVRRLPSSTMVMSPWKSFPRHVGEERPCQIFKPQSSNSSYSSANVC
jgi:hypothetical protein